MIKHIVFWNLKDQAKNNSKNRNAILIKEKLEALNGKINGLKHLEVGIDFSGIEASCDLALYSEFESREALTAYQKHPEHLAIAEFVAEVRKDRFIVDYEI